MSIRIGISGWVYPNWRKVFYPPDLAQKDELAYASRQLTSIEINSSFYRNQSIQSYRRWYSQVPDNFIFSVKGPQYITHILRLRKTEEALANFFASGVLSLNEKLGAFLWQLPPNFLFDEERLENFFRLLPKTMSEALTLADRSTKYPATYSEMNLTSKRRLQHALEVRNHSFENPDFIKLLRKYNIALVLADTAGRYPYFEDITADFVYLRLHGDEEFYVSGYQPEMLKWWVDRILSWSAGSEPSDALKLTDDKIKKIPRDIYIYFDNDLKVKAPHDAQLLQKFLRILPRSLDVTA